jgi:hypothetical protein
MSRPTQSTIGPRTRESLSGWVVSCVVAILIAVPLAVAAADADDLIRRGVELRRQQRDVEALELFQAAYEQSREPRALVQMGLAEQALGKWGAAHRHLRAGSQASSDPWIVKNRRAIDDALGVIARHVGRLDVRGSPPGAEVRVDGELIGKLPFPAPVSVSAGGVAIDVRAEGYLAIARVSTVPAGVLMRETFDLQPLTPANSVVLAAPSAAPPLASPVPSAKTDQATPVQSSGERRPDRMESAPARDGREDSGEASRSMRPVVALGLAGLGVAVLVLGGVEHFYWQDNADHFQSYTGCDPALPQRGSPYCETLYDNGQRAKWLAIGGYGVGAGLLATAAILYLSTPTGGSTAQVACLVNPVGLGGACTMRF